MPGCSGFPRFKEFPNEIQLGVWGSAMPCIKPTLFPHQSDCWELHNGGLEHNEAYIPSAPYKIPAHYADAFACTEAIRFMKRNGFERNPFVDDKLTFMRNFDPKADVLFVPSSRFLTFAKDDVHDALGDVADFYHGPRQSRVTLLAVDAGLFTEFEWPCLLSACEVFPSLQALLVIVDAPQELVELEEDDDLLDRWEVAPLGQARFVWNVRTMKYTLVGAKAPGLDAFYALLDQKLEDDADSLRDDAREGLRVAIPDGFEVRIVTAYKGE